MAIPFKMGIFNLIRKLYLNQKTLIKIFFEVCIRFHKCCDGILKLLMFYAK